MAYRLWAEVWSADESTMHGIVNLLSVSVSRELDAAGRIDIEVPTSDKNAVNHLAIRRVVRVYWDKYGKRLIGKGILLQRQFSESKSNLRTAWKCTDALENLRMENTGRGRIYDDETIETIIKDLAAVAGWYVQFNGVVGSTSERFDGVSILQAIARIAKRHGYHYRLGAGTNWLEFGAFGSSSGVRLSQSQTGEVNSAGATAYIDQLTVTTDGYDVVNWIEPISGPLDGGLTLRYSTRTSPYTIMTTTGPNGATIYYLTDSDSVTAYGTIKQVYTPDHLVVPLEPNATALQNAANALYDAAASWLSRHADPQVAYRAPAVKVDKIVRPGDKIRVAYIGEVFQNYEAVRYAEIDDEFWVMKVQERYNLQGVTYDWEISNVDRKPENTADMLADLLINTRVNSVGPSLNVDRKEFTSDAASISKGSDATVAFEVRTTTVDIPSCRVTITRNDTSLVQFAVDIDGTEVTGGPWLWTPSGGNSFTVEIADILIAAGTIQGDHTLTISVLHGSGTVDVVIALVEAVVPGIAVPSDPFLGRSL